MNASTTTVLNDTRHCFLPSFSNRNSSINSATTEQTSVHPSNSTSSSFPNLTANRCDSVGDSLESVSSTTSNNSFIDSDISIGNQKNIPFSFYSLPYGSEVTQPVVNPFLGFASAFPSAATYKAATQGYSYPSHFFRGSEENYRSQQLGTTNSRTSTTPSSRENILTNSANDLIAAAAVAAAAAASTSGTNNNASSSSSSVSSSSSTRSSTTGGPSTTLQSGDNNNIGGTSSNGSAIPSTASTDDHIQRLAQMTHGVGLVKSETGELHLLFKKHFLKNISSSHNNEL